MDGNLIWAGYLSESEAFSVEIYTLLLFINAAAVNNMLKGS